MGIGYASKLNRYIELWENYEGQMDALGQRTKKSRLVTKLWAGIVPQTGSLITGRVADTMLTSTTHKVLIRPRPVDKNMWFQYGGQRYDILYILDPYEKHDTLEVFCKVIYES